SIVSRSDGRGAGVLDAFAPSAKVVHADIDPAEISKSRLADVPIVGEASEIARALTAELRERLAVEDPREYESWWNTLNMLRENYPLGWTATEDGFTAPQKVIS